ncbi:MAG: type IV secretory system conjugative DNA transfer family protein [Acidimicrobiales bacterium]
MGSWLGPGGAARAASRAPGGERGGAWHPPDRAWVVAGAAVAAPAFLAWAAGEVAGRLAGGRWPAVPASAAGGILVGLLRHPGRPASAWPGPAHAQIPGPAAYYAVAAGIAACSVLLALGLVAAWRTSPPSLSSAAGRGPGGRWGRPPALRPAGWAAGAARRMLPARGGLPPRGSSWARPGDLRPLVVGGPTAGRLTLGRSGRRYLAAEARQSVIVVGPTQTHKTSGFAVPAILEWEGPVLATSVKADLVRDTLAWRERCGQVWLYDPTASTGLPASGWSPLAGSLSWSGARRMAAGLCGAARAGGGGLADADFWYATAAKLLAPLLLAAACSGRTMAEVVRWVDDQEMDEVDAILEALDVPEAAQAARASWRREDRQRSSVYTTAETVLEAFADPVVAASSARSDVDPSVLLGGGSHTLFVCAPAHEQQRLQPVFSALVRQVLLTAYERVTRRAQPLDPPLLVVLDEAANVAPLAELDALAATAAGHGIQLVTVWQDMAQVAARYGPRAATVVNNHRAKVVLSGISDPATLDHVSVLVGDEEVAQASTTTDADGRRSTTQSTAARRLAPADALRRIRPGQGVLVYGHLPPARLSLRPWFADRELARRAGTGRGTG